MTILRPFRTAALLALWALSAPIVRAGDWEVVRHEGRDYVTIASLARFYAFPTPVPPVSQMQAASPQETLTKALVLDNGKHQIQFMLNSRLAVIDGVNQWLGFPVIEDQDRLIITRLDLAKVIEPTLRPELIPGLKAVNTVVLDPGHGGHDKGAVSIFGSEKDFALDVCLRAKALLEGMGLKVIMTRSNDTFIPLEQRPTVANRVPNSIFVAVHFNDSVANSLASGFEIYSITPQGEPSSQDEALSLRDLHAEPGNVTDSSSLALSESIYYSLLGNIPQVDRGVKRARFAVVRLAQVPAVLIEGGFVSSSSEVRQIATPAYRQNLAQCIVTGIAGFKALAEHKVPPKLVADYRRATSPAMSAAPVVVTNGTGTVAPSHQ